MDEKKVDVWEFEQAVAYMDTDPNKAKELFSKYLQEHNQDYIAHVYYASVHVILGDFDKAEEILNNVEELVKEDEYYKSIKTRIEYFEKMSTFARVKVLTYKQKYETLSENYDTYLRKLKTIFINEAEFLGKLKTGKLESQRREHMGGYAFKQLFEYREEDFKEHMKKHLYQEDETISRENKSSSIFAPEFPFDKVLTEVKKSIPNEKSLYFGFTNNTYFFKYDGCGKSEGKITDYFEVITIHGTNNIISMYPTNRGAKLPYMDLNYLQENNIKKKAISQIDKFNKRYKSKG